MDNFETHLMSLIQLAVSDENFDPVEKMLIYSIGKAHGVTEARINELIKEHLETKPPKDLVFSSLSFDERFEFLYNIIQLMKIDNEVFLSEIKYCEDMAEKLGFKKKVVKTMSARIFSDPAITANRELLKKEAKKLLA
ncbi:TerB family tellurite resistance protein [Marinoscillum pacificum]|uniref:TerB family tellurite resistance protein n=1 Tax=Marinoscillum pacificum TaxID=392723 RepID=UPI0021577E96|nr:TerB family tellurite resistance protein [Marinoscillum pacificum]